MSSEIDKITISHDDVIGLFCLSMLIYDYGKKFTINEDLTLEEFMTSDEHDDLENYQKDALETICERTSQGRVVMFLNDKVTDLQAGITISEKRKKIYIVIRGSESKMDWMYDLRVRKKDLGDDIEVHNGFYKQLFDNSAYDILSSKIKELVENDKYKDYEINITGHSLGSSICLILSYFLSFEIKNKIVIVGFGGPRVGNKQWRKAFDNRKNIDCYRVTNQRDIITVTPFYNYYHVGKQIRLCDNIVEYYPFYPWLEYTIFSCWSPSEHYCDCYFDRLKKLNW